MSGEEDDLGQLEELPMSDDDCSMQQKATVHKRRYYSTEELMGLRFKPDCKVRPSCLSDDFCDDNGIWDPSLWHSSLFGKRNPTRSREFSTNFKRRPDYRNSLSQVNDSNHVSVFLKSPRQFCPRLTQRSFRRYKYESAVDDSQLKRKAGSEKISTVQVDSEETHERKLSENKSDPGEPEWMSASSEQLDDFQFGDLEELKKEYNESMDKENALNARDVESRMMESGSSDNTANETENCCDSEVSLASDLNVTDSNCEKNEKDEMKAFNNLLLKMKDTSNGTGSPIIKTEKNQFEGAKLIEGYRFQPTAKSNVQESLNRLKYKRIFDEKVSKLVQNEMSWPKSWNSDRVQGMTEPKFHGLNLKEANTKNQRNDVSYEQRPVMNVPISNFMPQNFSTLEALLLEQNLKNLNLSGQKVPTALELKLLKEKEVLMARIAALQALQLPAANYGLNEASAKNILQLNLEKQVLESQLQMCTKNLVTALQEQPKDASFVRDDATHAANAQDVNAIMQARTEAILRLNGINLRKHPQLGLLNLPNQTTAAGNFVHPLSVPVQQNMSHRAQFVNQDLLLQQKLAELLQVRGSYGQN